MIFLKYFLLINLNFFKYERYSRVLLNLFLIICSNIYIIYAYSLFYDFYFIRFFNYFKISYYCRNAYIY